MVSGIHEKVLVLFTENQDIEKSSLRYRDLRLLSQVLLLNP